MSEQQQTDLEAAFARGEADATVVASMVEAFAVAAAGPNGTKGAPTALVSVSVEMLAPGIPATIDATVERLTRTLVFLNGQAFDANNQRLASATAIHKIT